MPGRQIQLQTAPSIQSINEALANLAARIDRLEGRGSVTERVQPLIVAADSIAGTVFRAGNITLNRYGADLEKGAVAFGAMMDTGQQWIALQTIATILEFDTTQNAKYYYNTGLTPGVPYTPTLDLTVAL